MVRAQRVRLAHVIEVPVHPPMGEDLQKCMKRFEEAYTAPLSKFRKVIAIPAAHHRLPWIHPFLDGNGHLRKLKWWISKSTVAR